MTTQNIFYGAYVAMTVTNLQSMASSATAGWQSARVSNISGLALDYEIAIKLPMANTAPANDKAIYVYVAKGASTDGGTTWIMDDGGTTTPPSGTEGTYTIAGVTTTNGFSGPYSLPYTTQNQIVQGNFNLSNLVGQNMPQGWSLIIVDYSGAALITGCTVGYVPITTTSA